MSTSEQTIREYMERAEAAAQAAISAKTSAESSARSAISSRVSANSAALSAARTAAEETRLQMTSIAQTAQNAEHGASEAYLKSVGMTVGMNEIKQSCQQAESQAKSAKTSAESAKNTAQQAAQDANSYATAANQAKETVVAAISGATEIKNQTQALHDDILTLVSIPVGHAYNIGVVEINNSISITWSDPNNNVNEYGATLAYWGKTRLLYKEGGFPENETDGTVLIDNVVKNAYRTDPFVFSMGSGSNYYFALFTCTTGGVWNTSDSAPRFIINYVSFATIQQIVRAGLSLHDLLGLDVGSVVNIETSRRFNGLRWKLAHVDYFGNGFSMYDTSIHHNAIFIADYLPSETNLENAIMCQFDAPEMEYAITWDTHFIAAKKYYTMSGGTYSLLVENTDYTVGNSIADWTSSHNIAVYTNNHANRKNNGHNSWKESNMRQWLNATGTDWFQQQNEYDKLSTNSNYTIGFKGSFNSDFLELVQPVYNLTARNTIAQVSGGGGGGYDTTLDTFWLPSIKEVFNSNNNNLEEGSQFDYFKNVAVSNADRIQYDLGGTARRCWLRSPNTGTTDHVYCINTSGSSGSSNANNTYGFLPSFCL